MSFSESLYDATPKIHLGMTFGLSYAMCALLFMVTIGEYVRGFIFSANMALIWGISQTVATTLILSYRRKK